MATLGSWEYTCDRSATMKAYSRANRGGSDTCSCNTCRNFDVARDTVFPPTSLSLVESLGIDPAKDGEVYHNALIEQGRHGYGGWFHFVGTLDKDGDFAPVEFADGFVAWMQRASAPALSSLEGQPLVQLEFNSERVPWVLHEPEPDYQLLAAQVEGW